jgi:hypothetical protein
MAFIPGRFCSQARRLAVRKSRSSVNIRELRSHLVGCHGLGTLDCDSRPVGDVSHRTPGVFTMAGAAVLGSLMLPCYALQNAPATDRLAGGVTRFR